MTYFPAATAAKTSCCDHEHEHHGPDGPAKKNNIMRTCVISPVKYTSASRPSSMEPPDPAQMATVWIGVDRDLSA